MNPNPCPFCRSTNLDVCLSTSDEAGMFVKCLDCHAEGPLADDGDVAIAKWNNKREPDEAKERVLDVYVPAGVTCELDITGVPKGWTVNVDGGGRLVAGAPVLRIGLRCGEESSPNNTHRLKCWPQFFQATKRGEKLFEVRKDDRHPKFQAGDTLILEEYNPTKPASGGTRYTGDYIKVRVVQVWRHSKDGVDTPLPGLLEDYCVMQIGPVEE